MNTTVESKNQIFDGARFVAYFKYYAGSNGRRLQMSALGILLAWVLMCVLPPVLTWFGGYRAAAMYSMPDYMWVIENLWGVVLLMVLCAVSGSRMFSAYHNPRGRIGLLTTPASALEKFATYFIIYVIGFMVVFYVSAIVGDALRVGAVKLLSDYGDAAHMRPLADVFTSGVASDGKGAAMSLLLLYGSAMFTLAWFSLGSILWSKNSFVKSLGAAFVFNVVYGLLFSYGFKTFCHRVADVRPRFESWTVETSVAVGITTTVVAIVFVFWLAYRRFREADIIERW